MTPTFDSSMQACHSQTAQLAAFASSDREARYPGCPMVAAEAARPTLRRRLQHAELNVCVVAAELSSFYLQLSHELRPSNHIQPSVWGNCDPQVLWPSCAVCAQEPRSGRQITPSQVSAHLSRASQSPIIYTIGSSSGVRALATTGAGLLELADFEPGPCRSPWPSSSSPVLICLPAVSSPDRDAST
ncbi:hypothetical protein NM208_g12917 [Fusarium decemcellulare]|uniref:Uncharacterized protein n=1 Tax=Fusarium decemcellulare TaxID=57161 RepID=A0ACC1RN64_9HYPO|nr:hypothetical protein NM208_g12917 [Fusarium decemcellulare]